VKFDLMTRLKTTQLPAAFANVTDICGSVDAGAGKLAEYQYAVLLLLSEFDAIVAILYATMY